MIKLINPDYSPRNFVVIKALRKLSEQRRARQHFAALFRLLKFEENFIYYKILFLQYDRY